MAKRILVVDDTPINRKLAMAMLKRDGWEVDEAEDGATALGMLAGAGESHGFHAVLLDISMPGLCGDDVCRSLRADARTAALPVVAYTAHAMEEERERFFAAGFDAVLIKPINAASLRAALDKALAARS